MSICCTAHSWKVAYRVGRVSNSLEDWTKITLDILVPLIRETMFSVSFSFFLLTITKCAIHFPNYTLIVAICLPCSLQSLLSMSVSASPIYLVVRNRNFLIPLRAPLLRKGSCSTHNCRAHEGGKKKARSGDVKRRYQRGLVCEERRGKRVHVTRNTLRNMPGREEM